MGKLDGLKYYSPEEEKINVVSHAIGCVLSIIATIFLITYAILDGNIWHIVGCGIFGISLTLLYTASTIYHSSKEPTRRYRLKIFDHAAIYVLIAGTYTPFTLIILDSKSGWIIFGVSWALAFAGIVLKLFFVGKFNILSTIMYVVLGWVIVFDINTLLENLHPHGVNWLFSGGIAYTVGAVIYSIKRIQFNHAIFHLFVLAGSFCHFMAVFYYVLPNK